MKFALTSLRRGVALGLVALAVALMWSLGTGAPPLADAPATMRAPLRQPTGANMVSRDFVTADSLRLPASQVIARSRGTVVLLHGLSAHEAAADTLAPRLSQQLGYNVIVFPLRSAGVDDAHVGDVDGAEAHVRDVAAVVHDLRRHNPSGPIVLVGVGVGGALAVRYLEGRARVDGAPVDALVLDRPVVTRDELWAGDAAGLPPDLEWHTRRARALNVLARVHLTLLDRLPVAYAPVASSRGTEAQSWTMRAFATLIPQNTWRTLRNAPEAVLFVSSRPPAPEWYRRTDKHEWVASDSAGLKSPRVLAAIADFLTQFTEAAAERTPIPPTQPLPVLQRD